MEIIICYLYFYLCNEILVTTFGIVIISAICHKKTITIIFLDLSQFQFVIYPCTPLILDFQGIYFAAGIKNMSKNLSQKSTFFCSIAYKHYLMFIKQIKQY